MTRFDLHGEWHPHSGGAPYPLEWSDITLPAARNTFRTLTLAELRAGRIVLPGEHGTWHITATFHDKPGSYYQPGFSSLTTQGPDDIPRSNTGRDHGPAL